MDPSPSGFGPETRKARYAISNDWIGIGVEAHETLRSSNLN
jgi:hypothetical protein